MTRRVNYNGYTLIELMMALAFVAFVLLFIMTALIDVMRTYNKGLAVKEINQTARTTMDDMARQLRTSAPSGINVGEVVNGRLCLGGVSYVWNRTNQNGNRYTDGVRVTMARVNDLGGALCVRVGGNLPNVSPAQATVLLSNRVWVQSIAASFNPATRIARLSMELSTTDDSCRTGPESEFCAVSQFNTTVVVKGR